MNIIDIKYKAVLNAAKSKINPIQALNQATNTIILEAKDDGAERYRYWFNKIRRIHPLVDRYLKGQFYSADISDVTGEHIINTQADTQSVDLKYYYKKINNNTEDNNLLPSAIRNSIRNKLLTEQLKTIEDSYNKLNESYALIMSTLFQKSSQDLFPTASDSWVISRVFAHSYYNTQDFYGFSIKVLLYDSQYGVLDSKYKEKLDLIDSILPIKESIVIDHAPIIITVENKQVGVDLLNNKIIKMPSKIDESILEPVERQ
jgi:hypothetical protein